MGGNALKSIKPIRLSDKQFFELSDELIPKLKTLLGTDIELIKSFKEKADFGDMDLLVLNNGNLPEIKNTLKSLNPYEIFCNGNVYSFDYKNFQIDLILTKPENWITSQIYFSYNDLGNLIGKLFHKFGLKYGFDGLKYVYRYNNNQRLGDILISRKPEEIFSFIDLDWKRFKEGFNNLNEIFNYVISSKYFNSESYKLENLNHTDKRRDKRRVNYNKFISYINNNHVYKEYEHHKDKHKYIEMIDLYFPEAELQNNINKFLKIADERKLVKEKYNGHIIMEKFPELTGKRLGQIMDGFKDSIKKFNSYVLKYSTSDIMEKFQLYYNKIKKNDISIG